MVIAIKIVIIKKEIMVVDEQINAVIMNRIVIVNQIVIIIQIVNRTMKMILK
jgi:hypothetical protein